MIERIADTATHGTDRAILLQRMVFIKNFSGILRREVTDIGFDAEYNVLGQLIIVAGHCPKDHAVSGVLGVTVIVVANARAPTRQPIVFTGRALANSRQFIFA